MKHGKSKEQAEEQAPYLALDSDAFAHIVELCNQIA
jgi:hypothetical protein